MCIILLRGVLLLLGGEWHSTDNHSEKAQKQWLRGSVKMKPSQKWTYYGAKKYKWSSQLDDVSSAELWEGAQPTGVRAVSQSNSQKSESQAFNHSLHWYKQVSKTREGLEVPYSISPWISNQLRVKWINTDMGVISLLREPRTKGTGCFMELWGWHGALLPGERDSHHLVSNGDWFQDFHSYYQSDFRKNCSKVCFPILSINSEL